MSEMSIEVLISTMNRKNPAFLENMNLTTPAIVVNQNKQSNEVEQCSINGQLVRWINSMDKGLSRSRNLALENATADICLIADDDMSYHSDYAAKITEAYEKYPEADIIAFQVRRVGDSSREKKYRNKMNWENYLTSMKISSVEITFRRKSIIENDLKFNPYIGAGTEFYNGEENAFLYDALRKGCKILYLPIEIAEVDMSESSWFQGYDQEYFKNAGAKFYNMSKKYYKLLILQFALRKHSMYKDEVSIWTALQYMNKGAQKYKREYES